VRRYAYDEASNENAGTGYFDNEAEFLARVEILNGELPQRSASSEYIDPQENITEPS